MRDLLVPSSKNGLSFKLLAFDVAVAYAAPGIALWLRDLTTPTNVTLASLALYTFVATFFSVICFALFRVANFLPKYFTFGDAIEIGKASACSVMASAAFLFTLTRLEEIPRSIPALHFVVLASILILGRLVRRFAGKDAFPSTAETPHHKERNVIIVGSGPLASFYIRLLDSLPNNNWRIAGILDEDPHLHGHSMFGHFIIGSAKEAATLLDDFAQHGVDIFGFFICECSLDRAREARKRLEPLCVARGLHLENIGEQLGIANGDFEEQRAGEAPAPSDRAANPAYTWAKSLVEPAIAGVALLALSPLLALISLLVLVGMGSPVLFWQRRIGKGGRTIYIYKFRTMRNPVDHDGRLRTQSERVSLIGQFLRATRLDELPQLYNILRGDMAIVGPRPLLPVDQPSGASSRLAVLPGLTGWAQIHGGKLVTPEEKKELDEWYVRNVSLRLDLEIILRTVAIVLRGDRRQKEHAARVNARWEGSKRARRISAADYRGAPTMASGDGRNEAPVARFSTWSPETGEARAE